MLTVSSPPANDIATRPAVGRRPGAGPHPVRLRRWFLAYVVWLTLLTVAAIVGLQGYEAGGLTARSVWIVALGVFYLSLCCLFFPAPTAWIVMLLASNEISLIALPVPRVLLVALVCAVATGVANLNEYHVVTFLLRYGWIARMRDTRIYHWACRWFAASPFLVVAVFGFLPLPVDVIRWLAILYRYNRVRYFLAYVVGRFPRYLAWSLSAVWLDLNWWEILLFQAALVAAATLGIARSILRKRRAAGHTISNLAGEQPIA